ncbi:MAG: ABC transporter ATP-binding protein [Alphaproteobacteria bacterium]
MEPILEIRDLSKRFGGVEAVRSVSFDVPRGGLVGLIGPNGAGKTTFVNLVSKHENPDSGSVMLDKKPIHTLPSFRVARAGLARTYQKNRLFFEESVGENILTAMIWGGTAKDAGASYPGLNGDEDERTRELLDFFALTPYRDALPSSLSHLQRRRAEVAQALALAPKLLMLDEPFAGFSRDEAFDLIEHLRVCQKGGLTTLIIDHNMEVMMEVCEYLYVMHHGALLTAGTADEVRLNKDVVNVYLGEEH